MDIGAHWFGDPWRVFGMEPQDRLELLSYWDTLHGDRKEAVQRKGRKSKLHIEDLRVLSVKPAGLSDIWWAVARYLEAISPKKRKRSGGGGIGSLLARRARLKARQEGQANG